MELPNSPRIPIYQAPTGSIAGPELAAAVAAVGGMGAMGLTWTTPDEARRKVEWVRRRTGGSFQANFALHFEPAALASVLEAGVPVVTFSWGLPVREAALVRSFGAGLGIQVASPEGARRALEFEPDFLVCQGIEAGGHVQSMLPLWKVLPEVVEAASEVPVVAAGGIATGAAIARAIAVGA
ncbi:MAG TPA: nitronate monooxygenase, partial [Fimbriimonas sp.]